MMLGVAVATEGPHVWVPDREADAGWTHLACFCIMLRRSRRPACVISLLGPTPM